MLLIRCYYVTNSLLIGCIFTKEQESKQVERISLQDTG